MAKTKTKPKSNPRIQEFAFAQNTSNSGALTFRCMELVILCDPTNKSFQPNELKFIEQVIETLNESFPRT